MVHSPIKAARAPIAASTGARTAPTTPIVNGKLMSSFPDFSVMVILRTLPSSISSFTFLSKFSPVVVKNSFALI